MKLTRADWLALRPSLIWAGGATVLSCLALGVAYWFSFWDAQALQSLQRQGQEVAQEAVANEAAWSILTSKSSHYARLQQAGVIRNEHRLQWTEGLDTLQRAAPELSLRYEIAPQRPVTGAVEGSAQMMASAMTLKYLASNEEVYSAVNRILFAMPGKLITRRCTLSRPEGDAAGISVDCLYDWLTIAPVVSIQEGQ